MIALDSPFASEIGFTSDKFDGYLWYTSGIITISVIISKQPGHGNFGRLLRAIRDRGFITHVPTPSRRMTAILKAKNFTQKWIYDEAFGEDVEIWESPAPSMAGAGCE